MTHTPEQIRQAQYELAARAARTDLLAFMQWCWWAPPSIRFVIGRHTRAICKRITQAVEDYRNGKSSYLLIDVPFRHGKSDIVSRALPAYFLGRCADLQPSAIMLTYGDDLAAGFSKDCKNIITSSAYHQLFPSVKIDPKDNSIAQWRIKGSYKYVTNVGIGSPVTGKGGNLIVLDDYYKNRSEAESQSRREEVWSAFTNVVFTRQDSPAAIVIVCATPWHVDDVRGRILRFMKEDPKFPRFEELSFPACKKGPDGWDYLCPELHSPEWYDGTRAALGPVDAAALLDCCPVSKQGAMFKRDWFLTYDTTKMKGDNAKKWFNSMRRYLFVDTASAKKKDSDYTVMWMVGLGADGNKYVLDGVRDHLSLSERTDAVFRLVRKWHPSNVYWETIGAMADAEHVLEEQNNRGYRFRVTKLHQSVAKADRIRWLEPEFRDGRIYFPSQLFYKDVLGVEHDLTADFLNDEFTIFPSTRHDDMLDCLANVKHPDVRLDFPRTSEERSTLGGGRSNSYGSSRARSVLIR